MSRLVDAGDREQYLRHLSNRLSQTDLLSGEPLETDPTKQIHALIFAAGKRRLDILEAAAILVLPGKWYLGITAERLNVMPLSQQFLSIHLKPSVYGGADASITFQQERGEEKVEETVHFQSPHLKRGRLSRAVNNIGLSLTSREHQRVEGVEFYLDRGDLVRSRTDGWGDITTTFQFNERRDFVSTDAISQTYTPTEKDQSGLSKIEVKLENPYTEKVELRCAFYTLNADGLEGHGTVAHTYRLDDGRLINTYETFGGSIAREKMQSGTNVKVFTNQGVERMQAVTASIPGEIDVGRLFRNLAQGEFAFSGMWSP